ncbi:hypothetical protein CR152_00750 [Massilia violaceinigra]|uniref:DUF4214 domain-containing protein n=1 Tax=Massilia violaceinigra TaxID=2045208 RepID=A0A2D2DDX9_9BURK|nr:DUF4214 domain-containing protein [Massilia violaceinigra]ATQ73198.1 hypothetical protein CR152_00750 [Massilia violaceinigra]
MLVDINGGSGVDTVGFAGLRADYNITTGAGGYAVLPKSGAIGGLKLLSNIERFKFSDSTVNVEYDSVVQALYVAYFGRAADHAGMQSFQDQLAKLGAPRDIAGISAAYNTNPGLHKLIDSFSASAESDALYPDGTGAFVEAVFKNVLGRSPAEAGLAFWSEAIDSGALSRANAAMSIMSGALQNLTPQGLLDAQRIGNTLAVASDFTLAIDRPSEIAGYGTTLAASMVRTMLATVTAGSDVEAFHAVIKTMLAVMSGELHTTLDAPESPDAPPLLLVGVAPAAWEGGLA